jgi:hypothetical protein
VIEYSVRYDTVCGQVSIAPPLSNPCNVTLNVTTRIPGPAYFYYRLSNFYQNHRRYVSSRNDNQLAGQVRETNKQTNKQKQKQKPKKKFFFSFFNNFFCFSLLATLERCLTALRSSRSTDRRCRSTFTILAVSSPIRGFSTRFLPSPTLQQVLFLVFLSLSFFNVIFGFFLF